MKKDKKQIDDQIDIPKISADFPCFLPMKIKSNIKKKRLTASFVMKRQVKRNRRG
jgi:hypothetical protein